MRLIQLLVFCIICLATAGSALGQIAGPTAICAGSTYTYTYDDGTVYVPAAWTATNGTVISQTNSGTLYTAQVQWSGAGTLTLKKKAVVIATLSVVIDTFTPTVFNVSGANGGGYCEYVSGTSVNLSGSQAGVSYTLYKNGVHHDSAVGSGTHFSWPNQTAGTYTVYASGACGSSYQMNGSATLFVHPSVGLPVPGTTSICGPGTITVTPGTNGNTIRWYNAPTGGVAVHTNTVSPSVSVSTLYYIKSYNSTTLCEDQGSRRPVTIVVNPVPSAPAGTNASVCESGFALATPGANGDNIRWYGNASGGTHVKTGLESPVVSATTTFYATSLANGSGCESTTARVAVTVTRIPAPVITPSGSTHFVYGGGTQSVTLNTSAYATYRWFHNGAEVSSAPSLVATQIGTYKLAARTAVGAPECESAPLAVSTAPNSQPTPINFVSRTRVLKSGQNTSSSLYLLQPQDVAQVIAYQDGLGRTFQNVGVGLSGSQTDLVSSVGFGMQGMIDSTYLPYATGSKDGRLRLNAIRNPSFNYTGSEQYNFYQGTAQVATDTKPFARTIHRQAPDGRVTEQGAPGTDWQPGTSHTVRMTRLLNNSTTYAVRYWKPDGTSVANYPVNTVLVNETTDENNNKVQTYTNKLGQTVLKRVQLDETTEGSMVNWLETYYVYNEYGQLTYQVPPKAVPVLLAQGTPDVKSTAVAELVYKYVYDSLGRVVEKKIPGAAVEYIVYDKLGRVALMQNGYLRATNQWFYIKYDQWNRPVYTGVYTNTVKVSRKAVQGLLNNDNLVKYETAAAQATHPHYTNNAFPNSSITYLTVNYYDNYDFNRNGTDDYTYDLNHLGSGVLPQPRKTVRGVATGSATLVVGTTTWLATAVFYDTLGRSLQSHRQHLLSGTADKSSVLYHFNGSVDKIKVTHNGPSASTVNIVQRHTYDHNWRLKGIFHSINGLPEQQLAGYTYNALGQLTDKKLHVTGSNSLQSVDLRYTIRGWLKSINNSQLTNDGILNDDIGDYFGMELVYNSAESGLSNTPYYNGNISAMKWKAVGHEAGTTGQRSYSYTYDKSDKLKASVFRAHGATTWDKEVNTLNENLTYDRNGNIMSLVRKKNNRGLSGVTVTSQPKSFDSLLYSYTTNTNSLFRVEDGVSNANGGAEGFANGTVNGSAEYVYNADGSLTKDDNKQIQSISYNVLGKPAVVTYSGSPTKTLTYTYDAAGSKLRLVTTIGGTTTTTDYIGSFVYTNNALSFFSSPEGRVVKNGSNYEYQYALADHQGNTRVVFTSATPVPEPKTTDMEASTNGDFVNYTNRVNFDLFDHTDPGMDATDYSQKLTGAANSQVGVGKSYKVYAGDKIKIEAWGKYRASSGSSNLSGFAAALVTAFGYSVPPPTETGTAASALNTWGSVVAGGGGGSSSGPEAFVNIIVFDKNYKLLDVAWEAIDPGANQVGGTPVVAHDYMSREYTAREEGYIFAYVSNENATQVDVYFDDVVITQTKGNVVQYNEYYPFGLQAANSWTRENNTGNNFLFNGGTELNATTNVYDLHYRNYDPILGRMNQVDPVAAKYASLTPYNYAFNDPVYWNDPSGADPWDQIRSIIRALWDSPFGGTWNRPKDNGTASGFHFFGSQSEAVGASLHYNRYHNSGFGATEVSWERRYANIHRASTVTIRFEWIAKPIGINPNTGFRINVRPKNDDFDPDYDLPHPTDEQDQKPENLGYTTIDLRSHVDDDGYGGYDVNFYINMRVDRELGPDSRSKFKENNPGLAPEVRAHERGHYEQLKKAILESSIAIVYENKSFSGTVLSIFQQALNSGFELNDFNNMMDPIIDATLTLVGFTPSVHSHASRLGGHIYGVQMYYYNGSRTIKWD